MITFYQDQSAGPITVNTILTVDQITGQVGLQSGLGNRDKASNIKHLWMHKNSRR